MQRFADTSWRGWLTAMAVFLGTGAAAYMAFDRGVWDLDVLERGSVSVPAADDPARTVTAPTRLVELQPAREVLKQSKERVWQVQLPDERWIPCDGDCRTALGRALAKK